MKGMLLKEKRIEAEEEHCEGIKSIIKRVVSPFKKFWYFCEYIRIIRKTYRPIQKEEKREERKRQKEEKEFYKNVRNNQRKHL